MMRLVTQRLTKIVNIPNMKDHGATGVTGCLKNVAYGCFSNVARSHSRGVRPTRCTAVGTLRRGRAAALAHACCRSWTACARSGTGGRSRRPTRYVFHPRQILFGTDPVAIDRLLLDVIDDKRKAEGAISIWDRSPESLSFNDARRARRRPERQHPDPRARPRGVRRAARPGRVADLAKIRVRGDRGVSLALARSRRCPSLYWAQPVDDGARGPAPGGDRAAVRAAGGAPRTGRRAGFDGRARSRRRSAPRASSCAAPGIAARAELASATRRPWIYANGWRFLRQPRRPLLRRRAGAAGRARRGRGVRLRRRRGAGDRPGRPRGARPRRSPSFRALPEAASPARRRPRGRGRRLASPSARS